MIQNRDAWMFRKGWAGEPVNHNTHLSEGELMGKICDRELAKAEEQFTNRMLGPMQLATLQEPELLAKSAEAGRCEGETLMAWYGKTGIDPRKLREWRIDKLISWAAQTARNDKEQGISEPKPAMF